MTRVRSLDSNGDMTFGRGSLNFYINTPELVGQNIATRLKLILGEWFLDTTQGTDWAGRILGRVGGYDAEIQRVILGTTGVDSISDYSSTLSNRALSVSAVIKTVYDTQTITVGINLSTQYSGNTWPQIGISYTIGQDIIL